MCRMGAYLADSRRGSLLWVSKKTMADGQSGALAAEKGAEGRRRQHSPSGECEEGHGLTSRWDEQLGELAELGREQGSVDGTRACQRLDVDDDVGQGVEPLHRVALAHSGSFDAARLGLTIDAFGTGALPIDRAIERGGAIKHGTHQAPFLDIDVFDTPFAFEELFVLAVLSRPFREQQGTAIAKSVIALGVQEAVGGMHAQ